MSDIQVQGVLKQLYRIAEAGEKGYATAAVNMPNPGIKVLLKSFARQRANFKAELLEELRKDSGETRPGSSIPAIIHRGRVAIFAGMAIEKDRQSRVVLREAALGERAALHEYDKALSYDQLPGTLRTRLEHQREGVQEAAETVALLRGQAGQRMVVGLFNAEKRALQVVQKLYNAGFEPETVQMTSLQEGDLYHERGATVWETTASGAFGGALWGGLTGILVGYGAAQSTNPAGAPAAQMLLTWLLAWLGFMAVGAIIGVALAIFIGSSISEGDQFDYKSILRQGNTLVSVTADEVRADEANRILNQHAMVVIPGGATEIAR